MHSNTNKVTKYSENMQRQVLTVLILLIVFPIDSFVGFGAELQIGPFTGQNSAVLVTLDHSM